MAKTPSDKLTNAIVRKDIDQMRRVLSKGREGFVNEKNSKGYPPIAVAAEQLFKEGMDLLLEQEGVDVNAKITLDEKTITPRERRNRDDIDGAGALTILTKKTKEAGVGEVASKMVGELLKKGAEVSNQDGKGNTPLHDAINSRDYNLVKALLASGADPNTPNKAGYTPLHIAANNSDKESLDMLLESGKADVNKTVESAEGQRVSRNSGANPLMLLVQNASFEHQESVADMAKSLIKNGSEINTVKDENGDTSLHHAARRVAPQIVDILTAAGADPRQQNNNRESAIDINQQTYDTVRQRAGSEEIRDDYLKANREITEKFQERLEKGASAALEKTLGLNSDAGDNIASFLEGDKGELANVTMVNKAAREASQNASTNTDKIKDILEQGPKSPTEQAAGNPGKSKER